ncbi:MAG: hypothetical protein AB8B65_07230 [Kordia sp.]|uniref:hypothetical protein n=1 Tax=Kordia sp. TaxID=1965332 RepID=UPI00385D160D
MKGIKIKNWKKYTFEFLSIFIAVISAFALNNWNENRNNRNAETTPPINYLIKIEFNANNLDRPKLSIARTFIHEVIHAEIFRKLLSVAQHPSIQLNQNQIIQLRNNYPGFYDYYMKWKWAVPQGQSPSSAQHEAMAQHYRSTIVQALREYDST